MKILISTALVIPFAGTAVHADSNTTGADFAGHSETCSMPTDRIADGNAGVNWAIDRNKKLYFEAGELNNDLNWKDVPTWIREIVVVPTARCDKLILPKQSDGLFQNLCSLQAIDTSIFDTSQVESMNGMFANCTYLRTLDLSGFDTSHVTEMKEMFKGCASLLSVNLSSFNTGSVTTFESMFSDCNSLSELDLASFNTSSVQNMAHMFDNCYCLKNINLSSFDTKNVKNFEFMFCNCALGQLDLSSFHTPNAENMQYMFINCKSLTTLNLANFDTSKITGSQSCKMLSGCQSLQQINLSNDFFKGDMSDCGPYTQQTSWVQLNNPRNVKSWLEMAQTMSNDGAGWWSLVHETSMLTFDTNGGFEMNPVFESTGNSIDLSSYIPAKTGYDFAGWYFDEQCTEKADSPFLLKSDITLYAAWKLQDLTLTFDSRGGSQINPVTAAYGSTVDIKDYKPTKKGYTFLIGWFTDYDCTNAAEAQHTRS